MQFVDTNVFIRYFTKDNPKKAQDCLELFQKAERGEIELTTSEAIIAEVVFILSSKKLYSLSREEIRNRLYPVFSILSPALSLTNRQVYLRALDLYALYLIDFEDAIAVAQMERMKIAQLYSYDKGFDRVFDRMPGVGRQEP
jgi:uncharacterized protein